MKIDFEFTHPVHGLYRDAINLPDDHGMTDAELDVLKQQRFDAWVVHLETPPVESPTIEDPVIGE